MLTQLITPIYTITEDDLDIDPDFGAPWMEPLNNVAGWVIATLLVVSVIILAVGAVTFFVGRAVSNSSMQSKGSSGFLFGLAGVVLLGSIVGIVLFAANINLF